MKTVHLGSKHNDYYVPDEIYSRIEDLVNTWQSCGECEQQFTQDNPKVILNTCKNCFSPLDRNLNSLRYIGPVEHEDKNVYYHYLGQDNHIYTSHPSWIRRDTRDDKLETLKYWGFPAPSLFYESEKNTYRLDNEFIHIHGDVRTAS